MGNPFYLKGEIKERKKVASFYHRLRISLPYPIGPITPGQFAMLKVEGAGVILPRPFAIHNFGEEKKVPWLEFLFKVVGKGTGLLAGLSVGSPIMVLAPLGKGFPDPPPGYKALLIAGGIGIAPLFSFIMRLKASRSLHCLLYGAKTQDDLICLSELLNLEITVKTATEDGSVGRKGIVTELLREESDHGRDRTVIYACGPEPMLKEVAGFAAKNKMLCWISLERRMACGVGACLGCVVKTKYGYKRVCNDGPIFEAQQIVWERCPT